jgi:hypothetical protein
MAGVSEPCDATQQGNVKCKNGTYFKSR